jgi:hypothetical protein
LLLVADRVVTVETLWVRVELVVAVKEADDELEALEEEVPLLR